MMLYNPDILIPRHW